MLHCIVLVTKPQCSEVGRTLYSSNVTPVLKACLQKECESLKPVYKKYVFCNVSDTLCRTKSL